MTAITRALARFAVTTRYEALPEKIRHEGVRAFVNWVGCAAGGSQEDAIDRALAQLPADQREAVLLRERTSGRWWMLRGVNLSFRAIEGGDMEDVAAVRLLRDACAVYEYEQGCWRPTGRTLFNMDTVRAAGHLAETHEQRLVFRIVAGRVVR